MRGHAPRIGSHSMIVQTARYPRTIHHKTPTDNPHWRMTMTRAETCIPRILEHEGGYVNDPRDPGGATNKGITIATFRRYINPQGSIADLKALTTEQAVRVYKAQYWDKVRADDLPVGVDYVVADFAVNSGPSRAAIYLQEAVGAAPDGKIGPNTLAAVAKADPVSLINDICDARLAFMKRLSIWPVYKNGWTARVERVRVDALLDARDAATAPTSAPLVTPNPAPTDDDIRDAVLRQIAQLVRDWA